MSDLDAYLKGIDPVFGTGLGNLDGAEEPWTYEPGTPESASVKRLARDRRNRLNEDEEDES